MKFHLVMRLFAGAAALSSLAGCGSSDKPADKSTTTVVVETAPAAVAAPVVPVTLASLTGDAVKGEKVFGRCKTCHVAEKGVNRVGPSLWGVVGRHSGTAEGFKYSPANEKSGLVWTPDELFTYLESPQKTIPGTYMAFAGVKDPQERADVIAYLKTKA